MEITRLLWLSGDGVTLVERRDGARLAPRFFPLEEGAALRERLAGAPVGRCRLVVERGEEECRVERLPRLRGLDRRRLLAATAERLFPDTPFHRWERLAVEAGEELWCFAALADPAPLEELPVDTRVAVTTPTRLLPLLLERLGEARGDRLVAWRSLGSGLRLVLLRGGRVAATRLAPEGADPREEWALTRAYLERHGQWSEAAAEPLWLPLGEPFGGRAYADPLFAELALEESRPPGYGDAPPRFPASRGAPLLLAGALLAGGWQAHAALELERASRSIEGAAAAMRPAAVDSVGPSPERVARLVERAEALEPFVPRAGPPLRRLGRLLSAFPALRLERLDWSVEGAAIRFTLGGWAASEAAAIAVAELARRLREEEGMVRVTVTRSPSVGAVNGASEGVAERPFQLSLEARVADGWG